jgi:hypothetical protein
VLEEFPGVEVERVNVLDEPERLRALGLRRYPTLACGDSVLTGFFLTRRRIRKFLKGLPAG